MPSDLQIERPMKIYMDISEIVDERIASFKMDVRCKIPHPTGSFNYEASDIWFECYEWEAFNKDILKMASSSGKSAALSDMSEYFTIKLLKNSKDLYSFQFRCSEPEMYIGKVQLAYQVDIDTDVFSNIKNAFLSFPAWW